MSRMPRGFRRGHDDTIACKHRDASCCDACAASHDEIVDALGVHYWISDAAEREAMRRLIAARGKDHGET